MAGDVSEVVEQHPCTFVTAFYSPERIQHQGGQSSDFYLEQSKKLMAADIPLVILPFRVFHQETPIYQHVGYRPGVWLVRPMFLYE